MLAVVLLGWWHFLAMFLLSGRGWHPYWWAYVEDIASVAGTSWPVAAGLSVALAVALLVPFAPPSHRVGPPSGWRTWLAVFSLAILVPQVWIGAIWLGSPTLVPAERTLAGHPTRPVLWIIAGSADVGLHLPKVDARRHDYYSVSYSLSIPSGPMAGAWAQICGDQLDAAGSGARHRCLVDDGWRIVHGRGRSQRINALLASTGADVVGSETFDASSGEVADAELLLKAASFARDLDGAGDNAVATDTSNPIRRNVLVLTGNTSGDTSANDAAMDAAIGEWLDRGGIALVTTNRPRRHEGWKALPARLYGVERLNLPSNSDVAVLLGKAGPGRLMGGWRRGTLYDVGCTAWELAGFGCRRVGHGISLTRERSITLDLFRSQS